ncbi:hypothetical protein IWW56_005501 [Coemansia sp. RSA 2131]|nr:hypothetical protein IWW56_005501 [Coemansia sp. RSA 2131]
MWSSDPAASASSKLDDASSASSEASSDLSDASKSSESGSDTSGAQAVAPMGIAMALMAAVSYF